MGEATIELLEKGVVIHNLAIPRKVVANYLRELPEEERETHFIDALEVGIYVLERAGAVRDLDFVRSQVEALIEGVQRAVSGIAETVEAGLAEKLGAGDGQVLAPIKAVAQHVATTLTERVGGVRELLEKDMDPDKRTSTLGRALGQVQDLLDPIRKDSIQGTLAEAIRSVTRQDGALAKSVKATVADAIKPLADEVSRIGKQFAAGEAVEEALAATTKKGAPFEEEVVDRLQRPAAAMGAELLHTGPDNRPGDLVLKFGDASSAAGLCIVLEARDRTAAVGRKTLADVADKAMAERGGNAAIYVSRTGEGLAKEIGEWGEGDCDRGPWVATTYEHLAVAVRFMLLRHRLACLREQQSTIDFADAEAHIERIRTALRRVASIKRNVTDVRKGADHIEVEAEALQSEVRRALLAIEESLRFEHA
jgi:hypothetical protein